MDIFTEDLPNGDISVPVSTVSLPDYGSYSSSLNPYLPLEPKISLPSSQGMQYTIGTCCSCVAHVLLTCCSCVVHVLFMCCSCVAHVLSTCCSCVAHVLYIFPGTVGASSSTAGSPSMSDSQSYQMAGRKTTNVKSYTPTIKSEYPGG
jgi:hypothetical protein